MYLKGQLVPVIGPQHFIKQSAVKLARHPLTFKHEQTVYAVVSVYCLSSSEKARTAYNNKKQALLMNNNSCQMSSLDV